MYAYVFLYIILHAKKESTKFSELKNDKLSNIEVVLSIMN